MPWVEGSSQSCRPPRQLALTLHVLCELCKVERRLKSLSVAGDTIAQMEGERSAGRGGALKGVPLGPSRVRRPHLASDPRSCGPLFLC